MAELSDHDCDIIANLPLSNSLYRLQDLLQGAEQKYNDTADPRDEICQQAISKLLTTLRLASSRSQRSRVMLLTPNMRKQTRILRYSNLSIICEGGFLYE
ncbi:hypothetical protein ACJ73_05156 [Blastomyces percursus]|uniref:Uncharacterized protein n=1 Tax=Blastomyces percursus TaxID=1658174 RepID=A0A1J9Q5W2_9EURO|nr:hypothetical protein ACJ73_05156 [Blastomyces percursus]